MECHFVLLVCVDLSVSEFIQPFAGLLYENAMFYLYASHMGSSVARVFSQWYYYTHVTVLIIQDYHTIVFVAHIV